MVSVLGAAAGPGTEGGSEQASGRQATGGCAGSLTRAEKLNDSTAGQKKWVAFNGWVKPQPRGHV